MGGLTTDCNIFYTCGDDINEQKTSFLYSGPSRNFLNSFLILNSILNSNTHLSK